ncbi:MAG TPA: isocitrate lyase/phosphoenolpyruvate mutase family protein [Streptosporangiaceae bacterium]|jgi:phosphoenolpyruvate phosphomutase|nr:isocitrate lyase/phosphoenolpyruvate mutase family protein [Streptosporangiaceae bacterium]
MPVTPTAPRADRAVPARRAAVLREAFAEGRFLRVAGAHDGLSARLAEEAGFDATWASGLEICTAHGLPDLSLLGLGEFLAAATTMHDAVDIPVIADCDTGFGGPLNAIYGAMRYEAAGIAAICLEDKVFPKRNSFVSGGHELLSIAEFSAKLAAVKEAQVLPETVLIARTEAFVCGFGVEEALARCHAYVNAGADAVLVHSKSADPTEVIEFLADWRCRAPVVLVPTTYSTLSAREAEEAGAAMVIYANHGVRAAIAAIRDMWARVLAAGGTGGVESDIATVKDVLNIVGTDQWLDLDR